MGMILPRPGNWCYRAGKRLEWTRIYRYETPFRGWTLFCHVRWWQKRAWRPFCWIKRRRRVDAEMHRIVYGEDRG